MSGIVFMDTETLGLDIASPVWEFAAVRRSDPDVQSESLHLFIRHHATPWLAEFHEEFARDYHARYSDAESVSQLEAAKQIAEFMEGRPHVVGAVPNFDTERISHQLLRPNRIPDPWHYHLIDVENLIVGFLAGRAREGHMDSGLALPLAGEKWDSNDLSRAVGVDPEQFERHTAMGDVRWVMAQWDAVMGGAA